MLNVDDKLQMDATTTLIAGLKRAIKKFLNHIVYPDTLSAPEKGGGFAGDGFVGRAGGVWVIMDVSPLASHP